MQVKEHHLYKTWKNIRKRCGNSKDEHYRNYGGRGIVVCDRWQSSVSFIEDMEPTWFLGASIERIDNDGPYSPENCRWATLWEQNRNKRVNVWLDFEGERLCLADVARRVGLHKRTLGCRLRAGLQPPELFAPVNQQVAPYSVLVETELGPMPTHHVTQIYGVSREVLYQRRKRGKTWRDGLLDPPDQRFNSQK